MKDRILFVDDEENILKAHIRNFRSNFLVTTCTSGKDALELVKKGNHFSVVVSDFNMPEMNGVQFLSKISEIAPDTVRLMLTGFADVNTAITAVNDGHVFRILTKPCDKENLLKSIYAAIGQYNLIHAERELLDKTLKGSIKVLIDILAVVSPQAFSQATRYKTLAKNLAKRMNIAKTWEIEIAALLSQIGCVAVPSEIINKRSTGNELLDDEYKLFIKHPETGKNLLSNIPRLEKISDAIAYQFNRYDGADNPENYKIGDNIPFMSRVLKVINDFDAYVKSGITRHDAINLMKVDKGCYDENILLALDAEVSGVTINYQVRYISVQQLEPGMILGENLVDENGTILVSSDNEISEVLLAKIINYSKIRKISQPFKILQYK